MAYTILIVDDEINIIKALKRIFDSRVYNICTASEPQEALNILSTIKLDMIICDYQMPGLNGIDVLKYARKIQPDTIRILLTGSDDMRVAIKAINEGSIFYYFSKPWDNEELLETIRNALESKKEREDKNTLSDILSANSKSFIEVQNKLNTLSSMLENHNNRDTAYNPSRLAVTFDDEIILINIYDILYVTATEEAVFIITKNGRYKSQDSLNALEKKLGQEHFFRSHRSFIVNLGEIDRISPWFNGAYNIKLKSSPDTVPVSRSSVKKLKEMFINSN